MHAPDGFLNAGAALATGAISVVGVTHATRAAGRELADRQVPVAGMAAAFLFAAQMFNFPVLAGTTGHLVGAALAAIVLGPSVGVLVAAIVVIVQALAFADGGVSALGYNILNLAIVPGYGGYGLFRLFRRVLPKNSGGVTAAGGLAAGLSIVLASMALSLEWLFGATAPVPFDTVFGSMVGVHLAIGIGEAVITAGLLSALLAARPDLVWGASDLSRSQQLDHLGIPLRAFAFGGAVVAVLVATVLSQFSFSNPDGLESVIDGLGIPTTDQFQSPFFADYATSGITNSAVSLAVAGFSGVLICLAVAGGLFGALTGSKASSPRNPAKT